MSAAAALLRSRSAHQLAQAAAAKGVSTAQHWQTALEQRLEADRLDPEHADPSWLEDALHPKMPGERTRRYHRMPGKTLAEIAREKHGEFVAYFQQRVTPAAPVVPPTLSPAELAARVVVPKAWRRSKAGDPNCTCGHSGAAHQGDADEACDVVDCGCPEYLPVECVHTWASLGAGARECTVCRETETLVETMAVEETEAFKQLAKECGS